MGRADAARLDVTSGGGGETDLSALRVLIVHDWLVTWAGSERCLEQLLQIFPQADVLVGVISSRMRDFNAVSRRARESWLGRVPGARSHHRWFLPLFPLAFATVDTRGYDLVISSSHAFAKCVRVHGATRHLCYCYSPPRYLWDLFEAHSQGEGIGSLGLRIFAPLLRWVDRRAARRVHRFVAISRYIADRIRRCYGVEAVVVYPPVAEKPLSSGARPARERQLLSLGRLVPYKRVDLAIEAANVLGERLVVAGDGPERRHLESVAGPTITFLGEVSESEAGELMERSSVMVFCAEEDFGIAPVEANAHGLPVVAFGRGGVLETLVENETGIFFDEPTVQSLSAALQRAAEHHFSDEAVRANARRFSVTRFRQEVEREARTLLAQA